MSLLFSKFLLFFSLTHFSFSAEYIQPEDIYISLNSVIFNNIENNISTCHDFVAFGAVDLKTHEKQKSTPDETYVSQYQKCLQYTIEEGFGSLSPKSYFLKVAENCYKNRRPDLNQKKITLEKHFDEKQKLKTHFYTPFGIKRIKQWQAYVFEPHSWKEVPKEERLKIIKYIILRMIGPDEVIKSYGFVSGVNELSTLIYNALKDRKNCFMDGIFQIYYLVGMREEFLTYPPLPGDQNEP
tara:strand:- start:1611 stop:2330 length:720 start_codon:yes stop_codon:yes gene_type:complete